jgi:hypothetical protein
MFTDWIALVKLSATQTQESALHDQVQDGLSTGVGLQQTNDQQTSQL